MHSDINNINKRINLAREYLGLTQEKLRISLGLSQSYISEIETGKKKPSDTVLIALAYRWEINFHWLLTGEGEMTDTAAMIFDKVSEAAAPYGQEIALTIERIKYIYQHGSVDQKASLYGHISRIRDAVKENKGTEGRGAETRAVSETDMEGKDGIDEDYLVSGIEERQAQRREQEELEQKRKKGAA